MRQPWWFPRISRGWRHLPPCSFRSQFTRAAGPAKSSCNIVGHSGSTQFAEVIAYFPHEQIGLLERREMTAFRHLAPMRDVGETRLHPFAHGRDDLLREHGNTGRHLDS